MNEDLLLSLFAFMQSAGPISWLFFAFGERLSFFLGKIILNRVLRLIPFLGDYSYGI